jgi:hypothetical protein
MRLASDRRDRLLAWRLGAWHGVCCPNAEVRHVRILRGGAKPVAETSTRHRPVQSALVIVRTHGATHAGDQVTGIEDGPSEGLYETTRPDEPPA